MTSIQGRLTRLLFVLTATSAAASAQPVPLRTLAPEMRIDGSKQDLVTVDWVLVARDGSLAMSQGQDRTIRFFSPAGMPLGKFGGPGQGPGEFRSLVQAGWLADTLWVYDLSQHRVTFVSPQRTLMRSAPLAAVYPAVGDSNRLPRFSSATPLAALPGGAFLVTAGVSPYTFLAFPSPLAANVAPDEGGELSSFVGGSPVPVGYDRTMPHVFRVAANGEILQELGRLPRDASLVLATSAKTNSVTGARGSLVTQIPFAIVPVEAVSDDGSRIVMASTSVSGPQGGTFRVVALSARGDTIYSREYPFTGVPIPRAIVDSAVSRWRTYIPRNPNGDIGWLPDMVAAVNAARAAFGKLPVVYPPFTSLVVGRDGTVWIALRRTEAGRPYLVLDPRGNVTARFVVPPSVSIVAADAKNVWTVELDKDDIPSIVRSRIVQ